MLFHKIDNCSVIEASDHECLTCSYLGSQSFDPTSDIGFFPRLCPISCMLTRPPIELEEYLRTGLIVFRTILWDNNALLYSNMAISYYSYYSHKVLMVLINPVSL